MGRILFISYCICFTTILVLFISTTTLALELPEGAKGYYKDRVSTAVGSSEGIAPTKKPQRQKGQDIGRRESQKFDFGDEKPETLTLKAWEALNKKDETTLLAYSLRCIELYEKEAKTQQSALEGFAPSGSEADYQSLNNVAAAYFIQAEFYKYKKAWDKATKAYQIVAQDFSFGQYWDPRGWWWKPSEISAGEIEKIQSGYYENK